jgi:hypothetical protein
MAKLGKQNQLRLFGLLFGAIACIPSYASGAGDMGAAQISINPASHLPMPGCGGTLIGATPCTFFYVSPFGGSTINIQNTSSVIAYGIKVASISAELAPCSVSVSDTTCPNALPSNGSCTITFTSAPAGPCFGGSICIDGTNVQKSCIPTNAGT